MRKPTPKMIEALVYLFNSRHWVLAAAPRVSATTWNGLVERGLVERTWGPGGYPIHNLTTESGETGLAFLIDTKRAVVAQDGSWVHAQVEPMTDDEITAALIKFEDSRAIEAETLAKADAIRTKFTPEFPSGLRLRNPQTGASFEVIEHTHAVRLRNLRTDAVGAVPQDMARRFERLTDDQEEAEDLGYRDQGLIEGTAAMLSEGRGSAIVNLVDGGRAWTPVDRVGEFDRASRRAPEAAWIRPELWDAAGALSPNAAAPDRLGETTADVVSDTMKLLTGRITAAEYYAPKPPVTGFLSSLNAALTPGEAELLDDVDTTDVVEGAWLASAVRPDTAELIARGLAYRGADRTLYLTAVGAELVKYRQALAAKDTGNADDQFAADHGDFDAYADGNDDRPNAVLTVQRLRRGLVLTRADRMALADLLDTVRRALLPATDPNYNAAWFDVVNTYRAHFGDTR